VIAIVNPVFPVGGAAIGSATAQLYLGEVEVEAGAEVEVEGCLEIGVVVTVAMASDTFLAIALVVEAVVAGLAAVVITLGATGTIQGGPHLRGDLGIIVLEALQDVSVVFRPAGVLPQTKAKQATEDLQ